MAPPTIADLLQRSKVTAETHTPLPYFSELGPDLKENTASTIIVTCCDPRCVPEAFFKFNVGEVIVHRNAGGQVRHALRDICILDQLCGLNEVMVVHHTDCGTTHFTDEQIQDGLKARVSGKDAEIEAIDFGGITDLEASVRKDMKFLQESPFVRKELANASKGFLFDIKTGSVVEVK